MAEIEAILEQIVAVLRDPHPNPLPVRARENKQIPPEALGRAHKVIE